MAQELLADPRVNALLAEKAAARGEKTGITAERILNELFLIGTADIGEAYNADMTLKALKDMPEPIRRAISAIDVDEIMSGSGKDAVKIGETKKVKFWNKEKGLELLGRHLRLFADVIQHDVTDRLADAMREAEDRIAARR
jgi:phage terminase small subunit